MSDAFMYANPDLREMLRSFRNFAGVYLYILAVNACITGQLDRVQLLASPRWLLATPPARRGRTGGHPARMKRERPYRRSMGKMPLTITSPFGSSA